MLALFSKSNAWDTNLIDKRRVFCEDLTNEWMENRFYGHKTQKKKTREREKKREKLQTHSHPYLLRISGKMYIVRAHAHSKMKSALISYENDGNTVSLLMSHCHRRCRITP